MRPHAPTFIDTILSDVIRKSLTKASLEIIKRSNTLENAGMSASLALAVQLNEQMSSMTWKSIKDFPPPEQVLLRVCGPSGYVTHKKFLCLAYCDNEYRPPLDDGRIRWQSVTDDSLSDYGWFPTHWAHPDRLPEVE